MEKEVIMPVYQQIAIDIASRIAKRNIVVGTKLHGRSTLAGEYNVSPETIRRAIHLLEDMNIVEVSAGSGIMVISEEAAFEFVRKFKDITSTTSLKQDIKKLLSERKKLDESLERQIQALSDYTERFKHSNPLTPIEYEVKADSKLIGQSIGSCQFWQNTGATIIAIKRERSLILSPGPYADLRSGDILVMIGDSGTYERVKEFL